MDMKEASAMTEASGLIEQEDGSGQTSEAPRRQSQQPSQDVTLRWGERLREVTRKAPLQSLFVAFLIGIWVARRR
ncbi:hypothetical protein [Bradyrhizobium uaiense]|uniref:Uncharacterized protein n=1 Tax=Bradyrhizobium uaiense TaxID=2594946 RepID=A0A6P1BNG8_9BRAD|nr:hypothetical protein [Bradyrhizobium uaiense]NEU99749.1 hypothetical protein [Bradyrhizobium uaiense]